MANKWLRVDDGANQRLYNLGCLQSARWVPGTGLVIRFVNPADDLVIPGPTGVETGQWLLRVLAGDLVDIATK